MSIAPVLSRRFKDTGLADPDSLHCLLILEEQRRLPLLSKSQSSALRLLDKARSGHAGRVPPAHLAGVEGKFEQLDGLFPRAWKRALVAAMLKPDGITTSEGRTVLNEEGQSNIEVGSAVSDVRGDLKVVGVSIEARKEAEFRYRIIGHDAWRMQKIIANGWAL